MPITPHRLNYYLFLLRALLLPPLRRTQPPRLGYGSRGQGDLSAGFPGTLQPRRWVFFVFDFPRCCFLTLAESARGHWKRLLFFAFWCLFRLFNQHGLLLGQELPGRPTEVPSNPYYSVILWEAVPIPTPSSYSSGISGLPNLDQTVPSDYPFVGLLFSANARYKHVTFFLVSSISSLKAWHWWDQVEHRQVWLVRLCQQFRVNIFPCSSGAENHKNKSSPSLKYVSVFDKTQSSACTGAIV